VVVRGAGTAGRPDQAAWHSESHNRNRSQAQQGDRIKRLGILRATTETDPNVASEFAGFLRQLAQLGWTEGQNLRVDYRPVSSTDLAAIRPHAEALVRAVPDIILAIPAQAVQALQRLTDTIPIVFIQSADPVQAGIVRSLTRPGGNITGFLNFEPSINTKYLQLLKDMAPKLMRVAVLQSRATSSRGDFTVVESVARSFGVTAIAMVVRDDAADIERSIAAFAREPNGGLILPPDNALSRRHGDLIVALAAKHRLPAIYSFRRTVEAGGLMSYSGSPIDDRLVASAFYVDRILRGAKPDDLPVQAPTKYELVIKLKTATDLGLTIPPALFALAEEVIE
jgi:putative ABC transport system substrate-binding protein